MMPDSRVEAFLEMLAAERGAAANTLAAYQADLDDFSAFLGRGKALAEAGAGDIAAYMQSLGSSGMAARTQARRLSALKQFYLFLLREGAREDNPAAEVSAPKLPKALPKYLSESEVEALLDAAKGMEGLPGLKAQAGLEILYSTGLRVTEMLSLRAGALTTDAMMLLVKGKGGKERMIPLSDAARHAAAALRAASPAKARYLFAGRDSAQPMTRQGFALLLKQAAHRSRAGPGQTLPACAAAFLCLTSACAWGGFAGFAEAARPCGHRHHRDLHPCAGGAVAEAGAGASPAGAHAGRRPKSSSRRRVSSEPRCRVSCAFR